MSTTRAPHRQGKRRTVSLQCHCIAKVWQRNAAVGTEYYCGTHGATVVEVVRPIQPRLTNIAQTDDILF